MHSLKLSAGRLCVDVLMYGPEDASHYGLRNWSLKDLQQEVDIPRNQRLADRLTEELNGLGIRDIFAPNVAVASGKVINPHNLTDRIWLRGTMLHRDHSFPADGVLLRTEQAFLMSTAGCPVIIASTRSHVIAAHAARDSLIDRGVITGRPTRENLSVVDAIIEKFRIGGTCADDIVMTMLFSIPAKKFPHDGDHPKHGAYNRKLVTFIEKHYPDGILTEGGVTYLNLEQVFVGQARQAGVRRVQALHSLAYYPDLVHTAESGKRNLLIVKCSQ